MNPRQTPLWIAQEQGFFAKHGVDADVVTFAPALFKLPRLAPARRKSRTRAGFDARRGRERHRSEGDRFLHEQIDLRIDGAPGNQKGGRPARQAIGRPGDRRLGLDGRCFGLEYLGLDARRDNINILSIGDQTVAAQALEAGTIDATPLDGVFSRSSNKKGSLSLPSFRTPRFPMSATSSSARARAFSNSRNSPRTC